MEQHSFLAQFLLVLAAGVIAVPIFTRLRLGGMALNNISAAFAPLHIFSLWGLNDRPAMLVGIDILRHFEEVTLDFGRREVTFVRSRGTRAA